MTREQLQLLGVLSQCKFGEVVLDIPIIINDPYGNVESVTVQALTLGGALTKEYDESIPYDYFPEDVISIFVEEALRQWKEEV